MEAEPRVEARKYERIVGFWRPSGINGVFSQWYPSEFVIDGVTYCCAEQYMMAMKASLFGDEVARARIVSTRDPNAMRRIGRTVRNFDDATWNEHRYDIVLRATRAKYANPQLEAALVRAAGSYLVELSPSDRIWGVGTTSVDPGQWRGQNLLGKALMQVRDEKIGQPR